MEAPCQGLPGCSFPMALLSLSPVSLPGSGMWILAGSSISSPALGAYSPSPEHGELSRVPPCFRDDVLGQDFPHAVGSFLFEAAVVSQFTLSPVDNRNKNPLALGAFEPECP